MTMGKNTQSFARLLGSSGGYFGTAGAFSLAINMLYLAGPLYMLQLYDRVVPSSSQVTLLMLTLGLLLAFLAMAGLDAVRARVLTRASVRLDRRIAPRIMTAIIDGPLDAAGARSQLLRDFDSVRQFISGSGIHAIFDLPWAPIYVAVIFLLHWTLGVFALGCGVMLIRSPMTQSNAAAARNYGFTDMSLRNVEAIRAMGMTDGLLRRWSHDRHILLERQAKVVQREREVGIELQDSAQMANRAVVLVC